MNNKRKVHMLLQDIIKTMLVIALFSVIVFVPGLVSGDKVDSYTKFKFDEFDWDVFEKERRNHWDDICAGEENPKDAEKCTERILKKQRKFYEKMYKLLAKANRKTKESGLESDDMEKGDAQNYIVETAFLNLIPSQVGAGEDESTNSEYMETYKGEKDGIAIDGDDNIQLGEDLTKTDLAEYYEEETDTLKLLISNLVGYNTYCYGIIGEPEVKKAQDGTESKSCPNGGEIVDLGYQVGSGVSVIDSTAERCVDQVGSYQLGQYVYYQSWLLNGNDNRVASLDLEHLKGFLYLGSSHKDEHYDECHNEYDSMYENGVVYYYDRQMHFMPERYFDFLKENKYFDGKPHLQSYFKQSVLEPAEVDCMLDSLCDNSLESKGLYEEYTDAIINVRMNLIFDLIYLLRNYGMNVSYGGETSHESVQEFFESEVRKTYDWPIGSDEVEVRNGVSYADGAPSSTEVVSYFGNRKNSATGEEETNYGIDIKGIEGTTNVIATFSGEVISVVSNCTNGDYDCNEGYGNTVIVSHPNGDYTVYANMSTIDVSVGKQVTKGEVLGKVGKTGNTNEAILHYELRVGGNSVDNAVDPIKHISPENPRPILRGSGSDFSVHSTSLTREEFISKVQAFCNSGKCTGAHSQFRSIFADNAGQVYDWSIKYNVNPELVIVRALGEASYHCGPNNHWGIACYNGVGCSQCASYSSLEQGIKGFANTVSGYNTAIDMMRKYAYIGDYWFNPGSWGLGGCPYFPYIRGYMSEARARQIEPYCAGSSCAQGGAGNCLKTTAEDQEAYAMWQVEQYMGTYRHNVFGL